MENAAGIGTVTTKMVDARARELSSCQRSRFQTERG